MSDGVLRLDAVERLELDLLCDEYHRQVQIPGQQGHLSDDEIHTRMVGYAARIVRYLHDNRIGMAVLHAEPGVEFFHAQSFVFYAMRPDLYADRDSHALAHDIVRAAGLLPPQLPPSSM